MGGHGKNIAQEMAANGIINYCRGEKMALRLYKRGGRGRAIWAHWYFRRIRRPINNNSIRISFCGFKIL